MSVCRLRCITGHVPVCFSGKRRNQTPQAGSDSFFLFGLNTKKSEVGNFLLSQEAALQVPSADTRLTAGFGMFPGIPTLLWSPTSLLFICSLTGDCPFMGLSPFFYSGQSCKRTVLFIQYVVSVKFRLPFRKTSLFLTPRKSLRSLVPVCSSHY